MGRIVLVLLAVERRRKTINYPAQGLRDDRNARWDRTKKTARSQEDRKACDEDGKRNEVNCIDWKYEMD